MVVCCDRKIQWSLEEVQHWQAGKYLQYAPLAIFWELRVVGRGVIARYVLWYSPRAWF